VGGPLRIGIVGVGKISEQYFAALPSLPGLDLIAVADLDEARAAAAAAEQGVEALTVDAIVADPRIDAILNLTIPAAHVEVNMRALEAGKHVFSEKPLALFPGEAVDMLRLAEEKGLRVGCAPDTFLGTGVQTSRAVLDAGTIGTPVGAAAFWAAPGHELWHPAPHFYYQPGAGPLFDMGPYYLTALVTLLGPCGSRLRRRRTLGARARRDHRPAGGQPDPGRSRHPHHSDPRARIRRHLVGHDELRGLGLAHPRPRGLRH